MMIIMKSMVSESGVDTDKNTEKLSKAVETTHVLHRKELDSIKQISRKLKTLEDIISTINQYEDRISNLENKIDVSNHQVKDSLKTARDDTTTAGLQQAVCVAATNTSGRTLDPEGSNKTRSY